MPLGKLVLDRFMTPYPAQPVAGVFIGLCLLSALGSAWTVSQTGGGYEMGSLVLSVLAAGSVYYFLWPSKAAAPAS